jgi:hypothetical protein
MMAPEPKTELAVFAVECVAHLPDKWWLRIERSWSAPFGATGGRS